MITGKVGYIVDTGHAYAKWGGITTLHASNVIVSLIAFSFDVILES